MLLHAVEDAQIAAYLDDDPAARAGPVVESAVASILANDAQHVAVRAGRARASLRSRPRS